MTIKKILYFDREFRNEVGGDKNRSRYLYELLHKEFSTSLCIVGNANKKYSKKNELYIQQACFNNPLMPYVVLKFSKNDVQRVINFIVENHIDALFFRTIIFSDLAKAISKKIPNIRIIIDVDLLFSRLMKLAWMREPGLKKRFFLIQWFLLSVFESFLFKKNYIFILSNKIEVKELLNNYPYTTIEYLQNTSNFQVSEPGLGRSRFIVFYGAMDSSANIDGYKFIHDTLYPLVGDYLKEKDYKIIIAGKGSEKLTKSIHSQIEIIGQVDSIEEILEQSKFVLLPIFIASGTNTRVIESAIAGRAVLGTSIAMEGLVDDCSQEYIANSASEMAMILIKMIEDETFTQSIAKLLQNKIADQFSLREFNRKLRAIISFRPV